MKRLTAALVIAGLLSGCGVAILGAGGETEAPAAPTAGPFTADQVTQCDNALNSMTEYSEINNLFGTQDVATDRAATLKDVKSDLNAYQFLDAPSAAPAWRAFGLALKAGKAALSRKMLPAQYDAAYTKLIKASDAWRTPCLEVRQWAAANTPQ